MFVPLALLCACQPHSDGGSPEEAALALPDATVEAPEEDAGSPEEEPQAPLEAPDAGEAPDPQVPPGIKPTGLFGRPDGPILPLMAPELVQIAVDLANEVLETAGYDVRTAVVPVYQGTVDEVSFYAGERSLGWTPGKVVLVGTGDLCESPEDYGGRLLIWVLTHELLHTVGFRHDAEMKRLTDQLGPVCYAYCDPQADEDAGAP